MTEELKRNYVIPLRRGFVNTPRHKRTNKAVSVLREFIAKHMKSDDIKIGPKLNSLLWEKGIKNPPGKVSVTANKDTQGTVKVELVGEKYVDFKQQEKVNKNASFKEKLQEKMKAGKETEKAEESKPEENKETKAPAKKTKNTKEEKAEEKVSKEAPAKKESSESQIKEDKEDSKKEQ
ncbi:MAG: 50S ribosomal protein L31e [Candidatus Woesearchaeota archaeon]